MTISATVTSVDAGGAQSGSSNVTVPTGCTCVAVFWHFYDGGTTSAMSSITLGGDALTLSANTGAGGSFLVGGGVGYKNNPLTGVRSLAWDWGAGGAREEGGRIYVIFFEGSSGAVSYLDSDWNGADESTNPGPLTLTSVTGGAVYAVGQSYGATNPDLGASGAQTVVNNNEAYNSENYDVAYVNSVGASTTNVSMSSVYYSSLGAVSVQEASGATYTLTADGGSYTLTGTAASTLYNRAVTAAGGSYTLTGTAATLTHNYRMPIDPGSYTLSGTAAGTVYNRVIAANAGSYTLTGTAAGTLYNRVVVADGGTYSLTGADVTLTYTPAGGYTLTCDVGAYTLTGTSATTAYNRVITADGGSYSLTGAAATLSRNFSMPADSGSYSLTGTAASTLYHRVLSAELGSYTLTGTLADLSYSGDVVVITPDIYVHSTAKQIRISANAAAIRLNNMASAISISAKPR